MEERHTNASVPGEGADPAAELARVRQRLAFYERFDQIIQENVARSAELLREAAARQAEADHALAAAQQELAAGRWRQRETLVALASDVAALRATFDTLDDRIGTELRALGDGTGRPEPPAGTNPSSRPDRLAAAPPAGSASSEPRRARPGEIAEREPREVGAEPAKVEQDLGERSLVVHGVAGVAEARRLGEWVAGRDGIVGVEPREFAGGVVRFAVRATRPLTAADVQGWAGGAAIETVEAVPDALVLRLPAAESL